MGKVGVEGRDKSESEEKNEWREGVTDKGNV